MNIQKHILQTVAITAVSLFFTLSVFGQTLIRNRERITVEGKERWSNYCSIISTDTTTGVSKSTEPIFPLVLPKEYNNINYAFCYIDIDGKDIDHYAYDSTGFWIYIGPDLTIRHIFPQASTIPRYFHDGYSEYYSNSRDGAIDFNGNEIFTDRSFDAVGGGNSKYYGYSRLEKETVGEDLLWKYFIEKRGSPEYEAEQFFYYPDDLVIYGCLGARIRIVEGEKGLEDPLNEREYNDQELNFIMGISCFLNNDYDNASLCFKKAMKGSSRVIVEAARRNRVLMKSYKRKGNRLL